MARLFACVPALLLLALGSLATAQASSPVNQCLEFAAKPPDIQDQAAFKRGQQAWLDACRQAAAADPNNTGVRLSLARVLHSFGERPEAVALWRAAIAQNSAEAAWEIYNSYNSFDSGHPERPPLITRAEAERALRKAADLGYPPAMWMLAVLLDRGGVVKRDPAAAIHWAEKALANPPKDAPAIANRLGEFLVRSSDPDQRARGIKLLEDRAAVRGRGDAQAYLAEAIRGTDPVRARKLLEEALRSYPGHAIPPLADMLLKAEGGPKDEKRALSLLKGSRASDVAAVKAALGELYVEGRLVPKDIQRGVQLIRQEAQWSRAAMLRVMALLTTNPGISINGANSFLGDVLEAADAGEPGLMDALIDLKLSDNKQFADKAGGCKLAREAAGRGDAHGKRRLQECGQN